MSTFRSFGDIVSAMIQRLRLTQPNLDTKAGTVSRDLFIDVPADQIARLYTAINLVAEKQSLATTSGRDLDKLASNFGTSRNTGSAATGIVVFCSNNIVADIPIPTGTIVSARNGATYRTIGNFVMTSVDRNRFAANASRMKSSLNILGISSRYAMEVPVQAVRTGSSGNISSGQIISSNLSDPLIVTNISSMTGGANSESDDSFRSRILSLFSGANIGTSFGYKNALIGVDGVIDALVVEPGSSLMLRDGTETIELDAGSSRILNSGTGGKVDAYILGRKIQEVSESFVFTDLSGVGNIADERNDFILGQSGQDPTRTSEERRVIAFKRGNIPAQPADSVISLVGSSSGFLTEEFIDQYGNLKGNYKLEKDMNPETGGSPFGFDRIRFISGTKEVNGEGRIKKQDYGSEPLTFTDISSIKNVYQDVNETGENSSVSSAGGQYIQLNHYPVLKVSKVINRTNGETYSIESQNIGPSGLNEDGVVEISGRALPSTTDVLSVNYTWRQVFDPYIDYSGHDLQNQFFKSEQADMIDWSSPGAIMEEPVQVSKTEDGLIYEAVLQKNVSKALSVYRKDVSKAQVQEIDKVGDTKVLGIELGAEIGSIKNILSIKRDSDSLEIYNTGRDDGYFESRIIVLPSNHQAEVGDDVTVHFNKVEIYSIDGTDGSFYNNKIALPSEGALDRAGLEGVVEDIYLSGEVIYAKYIADISSVYSSTSLSNLPIEAVGVSNSLIGLDDFDPLGSNQPIFYNFNEDGERVGISRFGPSQLSLSILGSSNPGKIKVRGETLTRLSVIVNAGPVLSGDVANLQSEILEAIGKNILPETVGIAKVERVAVLNSFDEAIHDFDLFGYSLKNTEYSIGLCQKDGALERHQFRLPSGSSSSYAVSSGDNLLINFLVYNSDAYEEIYFEKSSAKVTANRFARLESVSVSSGFRGTGGTLTGSIAIQAVSQPAPGSTYHVDYDFVAPKEGERITVSYNVNRLVIDATEGVERVRPITADILVKEAGEILVDVSGTILISDEALEEAGRVVDSVVNAVTNLLNTARLGSVIDYSDIISTAASQNGVDSVNISMFNETGKAGRKAFVKALDNQTISPGNVSFEAVPRSKFRIN